MRSLDKMRVLLVWSLFAITFGFDYTQHEGSVEHCHKHPGNGGYKADRYNTFEDIICFTFELAYTKCPAGFTCTVESMGKSFEGRDIYVLFVTSKSGKKAMWIDALIHTDEWLAGATTTNIMDRLLSAYGRDEEATYLLDTFDWYFAPVLNPDGYVWSMKIGQPWRKNRSVNKGTDCIGVDINRNFDYKWGDIAGDDPCGDTYLGPSVASESETRAIQTYLLRISRDLVGLWTMHAHSARVATPYGDGSLPAWSDDIDRVTKALCDAASKRYGTKWWCANNIIVTQSGKTGAEQDWATDVAGVKYAFVIGVRANEFIPDKSHIIPSAEEMWDGLVAFLKDIQAYG